MMMADLRLSRLQSSALVRLSPYVMRQWRLLIVSYACLVCAVGLALAVPLLIRQAIDLGLVDRKFVILLLAGGAVVVVSLARGLAEFGQGYLGTRFSQAAAFSLRQDYLDAIQGQGFAFYEGYGTGDLMARATVDVEVVRQFLHMGLLQLTSTLLTFIAVVVVMLLLNWQLGLVMLVSLPLVAWRGVATTSRLRALWRGVQDSMGRLTTILQENLASLRLIRAFGLEDQQVQRYDGRNSVVRNGSLMANRVAAFNMPLMLFILQLGTAAALWLGGRLVLGGMVSLGTLVAFLQYRSQVATPVRMVGFLLNLWSRAEASASRILEVVEEPAAVPQSPTAVALGPGAGQVSLRSVSFRYGSRKVLEGVTLDIPAGQTVALVGTSGSGKSTIAHLLARFYDPQTGSILIDGQDLKEVTLGSVRAEVGVVLEDPFLFGASLRENLTYGRPEVDQAVLAEVVRAVQLEDFVAGLPAGYATLVGERGVTLSGGQRQRVAIARVLLCAPRILVLDDVLSSVDASTGSALQEALERASRGRTTLVIAHRPDTISRADRVVVLENGRIVEDGTPQELAAADGVFRRLLGSGTAAGDLERAG